MTALIAALAVGYVIGLLQNGINIHKHGYDEPTEYNESVGIEEYIEHYDKNVNVRGGNDGR